MIEIGNERIKSARDLDLGSEKDHDPGSVNDHVLEIESLVA